MQGSVLALAVVLAAGTMLLAPAALEAQGTLTSAGALPHFASGQGWRTTWVLINSTSNPNSAVQLNFLDDNGNPAVIPLIVSFTSQVLAPASSYSTSVPPHGMVVVYSQNSGPISQTGWTQVSTDSSTTSVFEVFAYEQTQPNGKVTVQEGATATQNANVVRYVLPFNQSSTNFSAVAIANLSNNPITPSITIRDAAGNKLDEESLPLPAYGHTAFLLSNYPASANTAGVIELETDAPGLIAVLGLGFDNTNNAFFSIPPIGVNTAN
jgi:hypothetical protein